MPTSSRFQEPERMEPINPVSVLPPIYRGVQVLNLPEPDWLLQDFIQEQGITVIAGVPGGGKSLVMMDWAYTLAMPGRRRWLDKHRRTKQCKVLYIMAEGVGGLRSRSVAWGQHNNMPEEGGIITNLPDVDWVLGAVHLWKSPGKDENGLTEAQKELVLRVAEEGYDVVFVDTLAATFGGGNENAQQDMNQYMQVVQEIKKAGAAVVIAHHLARAGNVRGSTVLEGDADTVVHIDPDFDDDHNIRWATLACGKQKDGSPFKRFVLKPKVYNTGGKKGQSLVLEFDTYEVDSKSKGTTTATKADLLYAKLLASNKGMTWTAAREGLGSTAKAEEARKLLVKQGKIYQDDDGKWRAN